MQIQPRFKTLSFVQPLLEYPCLIWDPFIAKNRVNVKRFASQLCLKRQDSEYPKCWTFEIVNNLAVFQEAPLKVSYSYSTHHVHELSFSNLACIYLCTRVLARPVQYPTVIFTPHSSPVILNSMCVGLLLMVHVLVLILTCTSKFYDCTFGLLFLLMCTLLSRKLPNFNIVVMIIHCAGLCFKCKVSMHGLVPLKAVWESHSAWEWG